MRTNLRVTNQRNLIERRAIQGILIGFGLSFSRLTAQDCESVTPRQPVPVIPNWHNLCPLTIRLGTLQKVFRKR